MMKDTKVDIKDLEAFIDGLQTSLDMLDGVDITEAKGFQAQLAKTISDLRVKRIEKFEPLPKILGFVTKEDIKNYLLEELETLKNYLDNQEYPQGKFKLVMKIVKLREEINQL
ncbi:MAG: hypothetical protein P8Y23_05360 [Candidatus Lokiarchaeota archaeon]|jgi:hypothetical protein